VRFSVPRLLVFHTLEWANAARLALTFLEIGCSVYALCRGNHPLRAIISLERVYTYRPFAGVASLKLAILDSDPDLIIPCDDLAVVQLHRLFSQSASAGASGARICSLIERSLGRPDGYRFVTTRTLIAPLAKLAHVRLARTALVPDINALKGWFETEGFVGVLKADRTWGGSGVRIVTNSAESEVAFRSLTGVRRAARSLKQLFWNREPELFLQLLHGRAPPVTMQTFIAGRIANCSVACWNGTVIASVAAEVLVTHGATGNATVVRIVDNPDMIETATRIVRKIGGSGFFGFDFILEKETGKAFLLEINPRATQISHLSLGPAHDLPAALRAMLVGDPLPEPAAVTEEKIIAFFPQELRRDPSSPFLRDAYHDVPREAPELVQAFLAQPRLRRRLAARGRALASRLRDYGTPPHPVPDQVPPSRSDMT
jgi:hypothetical protein